MPTPRSPRQREADAWHTDAERAAILLRFAQWLEDQPRTERGPDELVSDYLLEVRDRG